MVPSYGQQGVLDALAPLGLTAKGFRIPSNWGPAQLRALQRGYRDGQQALNALIKNGSAGPLVHLKSPAGAGSLTNGEVQPVSQLGSAQLAAGQLALNSDGSLTLWFSPTLPSGVAASNWIPTPSTSYFDTLYPNQAVSTTLQLILRLYYPTPGNQPPSILPYSNGSTQLPESYIPPLLTQVIPDVSRRSLPLSRSLEVFSAGK
ncbi:DUF1214 domain-containing protein [Singulisphaera rosea]